MHYVMLFAPACHFVALAKLPGTHKHAVLAYLLRAYIVDRVVKATNTGSSSQSGTEATETIVGIRTLDSARKHKATGPQRKCSRVLFFLLSYGRNVLASREV